MALGEITSCWTFAVATGAGMSKAAALAANGRKNIGNSPRRR
jgi:hypothetical protein